MSLEPDGNEKNALPDTTESPTALSSDEDVPNGTQDHEVISEDEDHDEDGESSHDPRNGHVGNGAEEVLSGTDGEAEGENEEEDEDGEDEGDDEDDDEEPALKYERLGGSVHDLFQKDSASALTYSNSRLVRYTPGQ